MKINEKEYITVTNRVKVSMAIYAVKDILPGFDGVTTDSNMQQLLKQLYELEDALFKKINVNNSQ